VRQDAAEPLQVTAVPALFLDAIAAEHSLPAERCLDDCLSLACAYAQLGRDAQVRAAELVITVPDGRRATHGTLAPRWEDGMIHGHAVVWLPGPGHLVDVTAGQFPLIAAEGLGPVIAAGIALPRPPGQAGGTGVSEPGLRPVGPRGHVVEGPGGATAGALGGGSGSRPG